MLLITYWPGRSILWPVGHHPPRSCCFLSTSVPYGCLYLARFSQMCLVHQQIWGSIILCFFFVKTKVFFLLSVWSFFTCVKWCAHYSTIQTLSYDPTVWDYRAHNVNEENSVATQTYTQTHTIAQNISFLLFVDVFFCSFFFPSTTKKMQRGVRSFQNCFV